jgi:YaiO family outer membrane protein
MKKDRNTLHFPDIQARLFPISRRCFSVVISLVLFSASIQTAAASCPGDYEQGTLTHIIISKPPSSLAVDIILEGYARHSIFELKSPNKLVIDFPEIVSLTARRSIEFNDYGILRVRTGMFQSDTARVVIDFEDSFIPYQISTIPGGVRLTFPGLIMKSAPTDVPVTREVPLKNRPAVTLTAKGKTEVEKKKPFPLTDFQRRVARSFASRGKTRQARDAALYVLQSDPDNVEILILVGSGYVLEGRAEEAGTYLNKALELAPDSTEVKLALVDSELISGDPSAAMTFVNQGLSLQPDHPGLLFRKARILLALDNIRGARDTLETLLGTQPEHIEAQTMLQSIQIRSTSSRLFQSYRLDIFDRDRAALANLHLMTLGLVAETPWGPVTGRAHLGYRNQADLTQSGLQFDLSFNPRLTEQLSGHLHFGYSGADIFAKFRYGAAAYYSLTDAWLLSAGYNFYQFPSQNVHVATGGLSFTTGRHTFSLQPYLTNRLDLSSITTVLSWRHLLANRVDFIQAYVGLGPTSPEIMFLEDVVRINAQQLGLEIQRQINRTFLLNIQLRVQREEFLENTYRYRFTLGLRLEEYLPWLF